MAEYVVRADAGLPDVEALSRENLLGGQLQVHRGVVDHRGRLSTLTSPHTETDQSEVGTKKKRIRQAGRQS